jgi:hypothetical protein
MTAVEFLIEEVECRGITTKELRLAFEQAKEMEKKQIDDAWNDGNNQYSGIGDSETYYETFKKK